MKKIIRIDITKITDAGKRQIYCYRIASFSVDKISLEKHFVSTMNSFGGTDLVAELNEATKVGTITHKVTPALIPDIIQSIDEVIVSFESNEKMIIGIATDGIKSIVQ